MTASALYEGTLRHRRFTPVHREFRQRLFLAYVDLEELPGLTALRGNGPALRFRREDYFDGTDRPLDPAVRDLVEGRTGQRPEGPVRMLTQLRQFGHLFNPITIYYCFDPTGTEVETWVLEVTNTPWGERRHYVVPVDGNTREPHRFRKELHVSPFMGMEMDYQFRATTPGDRLWVGMQNLVEDRRVFDVDLVLRRVELSRSSLRRTLWRHPLMTLRVSTGIYAHALQLWLRRVPVVAHPRRAMSAAPAASAGMPTGDRRRVGCAR